MILATNYSQPVESGTEPHYLDNKDPLNVVVTVLVGLTLINPAPLLSHPHQNLHSAEQYKAGVIHLSTAACAAAAGTAGDVGVGDVVGGTAAAAGDGGGSPGMAAGGTDKIVAEDSAQLEYLGAFHAAAVADQTTVAVVDYHELAT